MINTTIAHYKVTSKLGQGGMGAVYRATDTKLDREVAIKILPIEFSQSPERLARFEREAKVLATLSHPNIAGIFGLEDSDSGKALVLELVEGEDLSQRLKRGPLPLDEALDVGKQIAEALEASHEKGVIHRDLKPGNVKLTEDGKVKVLDFGLAKAETTSDSSTDGGDSDSPTITADFTLPGTLLGTAGYMSPEQARGKPVDKRSDIWSFGCVLWECLTGQRLFTGETTTDSIGALLHKEIDWSQLPPDTPPGVQLLLRKCLARDRRRRLPDIGAARLDLEQAIADPSSSFIRLGETALKETRTGKGIPFPITAGTVLTVAFLAAGLTWWFKPVAPVESLIPAHSETRPEPPAPIYSEIVPSRPEPFYLERQNNAFVLSRDGSALVYNLDDRGGGLRRRDFNTGNDIPIPGARAEREGYPFLSWDGSHLGCLLGDDEFMTIPVSGGNPHGLRVEGLNYWSFYGADWSKNKEIVVATQNRPLRLIPEQGGDAEVLTQIGDDFTHAFPQFLPGGNHVLFVALRIQPHSFRFVGLARIVNVTTKEVTELDMAPCSFARYSPSGHLLYSVDNDVYAVAFDQKSMTVSGPSRPVLQGVHVSQRPQFDVADNGTLVYLPAPATVTPDMTLAWIDTDGRTSSFTDRKSDKWSGFALSSDERKVALTTDGDIAVLEKIGEEDDILRPLVENDGTNGWPVWSPDDEWVYFSSNRDGRNAVWKKKDGSPDTVPILVCESPFGTLYPSAVSSDTLVMSMMKPPSKWEIWRLDLNEEKAQPQPWITNAAWSAISPKPYEDWLAYHVTNPRMIYLKRMDGSEGSLLVDGDGSTLPMWSPNGDQIFYVKGKNIFARSLSEQRDQLVPAPPTKIGTLPNFELLFWFGGRSVSRDGQRFLALVPVEGSDTEDEETPEPTHLKMVSNWFTVLNRLVPPIQDSP